MTFELPMLVQRVRDALPAGSEAHLVGGAVRDVLLNRPVTDFDFVLAAKARSSARAVANALAADFYTLDEERDAGRVIYQDGDAKIKLDFVARQGTDLEADLRVRDLSINAIAVDLRDPAKLIDPTGGAVDLLARRVRAASDTSFSADPVRILRAVRMAVSLGFRIEKDTSELMRRSASALVDVSPERLRDELFRMLTLQRPALALRVLDQLGAIQVVLPELTEMKGLEQSPPHVFDVWGHTLQVLEKLSLVTNLVGAPYPAAGASEFSAGIIVLRLGRYRSLLSELLAREPVDERSRQTLLRFAALFHDTGKPATKSQEADERIRFIRHEEVSVKLLRARAKALRLSNTELAYLETVVRNHGRPFSLTQTGKPPSRRAIYRYFRDTGEAGVDICLLSLADFLGKFGPELPQDELTVHLETLRTLLEAYFEKPHESVSPPALLNGDDLMTALDVSPGPKVGKILDALMEAQAAGEVDTREQALALARSLA